MTDDNARAARELTERFWEDLLAVEPFLGTQIGDERFDDRLPDPSDEGIAARASLFGGALEELGAMDRGALDLDFRAALDVLEAIARRGLDAIEFRIDRFQAVDHMAGPGTMLADLGSMQRADNPERLDRYAARLAAVPGYLDTVGDVALEGARAGQTAPSLVADRTIAQVERLLALPVEESPALAPLGGATGAGRERLVGILRDDVMPAYGRYLEAVRAYRPMARETIGLVALPNGTAMYAGRVMAFTTLPLDPNEVHRLGLEELEAIGEERRVIAERLGFADAAAALATRQESGENTAGSREELARIVEEQVQRSWDAAPGYFGRLPKANCVVKQVEEFRERDVPMAFYQQPTADGSRPGAYYINTADLDQRPLHLLASVTYHEANPGHHFQVSLEQERDDRPALCRFGGILAGSAFAEGWGLYSERLADEMGLYRNDYERLGMLDAQAWRANRLVVDSGIHALGWGRDQAIRQMIQGGAAPAVAEVEVDRYIAWPGQALAYKIGQIEIQRWRSDAAERQGPAFSLPDFHDRLLALGSLPLPALRREIGISA
jgi:uncharacterized protein (DUF885 family)